MKPSSPIEFRPFIPSPEPPSGRRMDMTPAQMAQILWLIEHVGRKTDLDSLLAELFERIRLIIPCNRMGLALLEAGGQQVVSRWVKSDRPLRLGPGYSGGLGGSTLQVILQQRQTRIINDLEHYLREHPDSHSTGLLVEEGMRASLSCPLIVRDEPVGFLFFTSIHPGAYSDANLQFYQHVASQLSLVIERARLYSELANYTGTVERQNRQMNHDLDLARRLQQTFIPSSAPPVEGLDLALHYQPVVQVGGDILELTPISEGRLLVFVADAMGHGVQAALVMAMLKGLLASTLAVTQEPQEIMNRLNRAMQPLVPDYFAVAACLALDPRRNMGRVSRAGLPPPLLLSGRGGEVLSLEEGGLPLGIDARETYQTVEFRFAPGDLLLAATDGLIESINPSDDELGVDRVKATLQRASGQAAAQLLQSVLSQREAFCQRREQRDDMTLLAVRRTPLPAAVIDD